MTVLKRTVVVRSLGRPLDLGFVLGTAVLCLAIGRFLPGRLEALSPSKLLLLPVALLFVLAAGWLSLTRPLRAFVLGFALLGVVTVQPAPVDIVFALLIATTVLTTRTRPQVPAFVALPLACFVVFTLLSMINAVSTSRAVSFEGITLYMVGLAVWLSWAFTRREWVQLAIKTYIVVAVFSAALGPLALYAHMPPQNLLLYGPRAQGLFKDPNVYSAFLVPAAVILLEELTTPRILQWRRRTVALLFAIVSIGVVVAYSRAAWLNYAVAVATLVFVQSNRRGGVRRALKSVTILGVSALAGFAVLAATGSLTFLQERSHLQGYDTQRFSNQSSSLNDMFHHVLGYGPGQTELLRPLSTHSSYVRAAFEQGLPGLATIVLVLGGTLLCALLLVRRRTEVNGVGTGALLGIWLGLLANSFFIDSLHWRHLWIIAGLIWCSYSLAFDRQQPAQSRLSPIRT